MKLIPKEILYLINMEKTVYQSHGGPPPPQGGSERLNAI